jgi:hypothetical protein
LLTRTAERGVQGLIQRPAIEIRFESPTQNRTRARPKGDIVNSGILQKLSDILQLPIHMPGLSGGWHFRYLAIHDNLGPTAVFWRCAAGGGGTSR